MIGGAVETVGENREFNVATASDVTIYFTGGATSLKTAADDTATEKYVNTSGSVKYYCLRTDKTCQIVSINGVNYTEPITSIADKGVTEKFDIAVIYKMVIRVLSDDTNIKLRVR